MAKFQIVPGSKFNIQLRNGVRSESGKIAANKLAINVNRLQQEIGNVIIKNFNNTEVIKSLRGLGSEDLQAHFGLSNSLANELVDGMENIIRNSIRFSSKISNNIFIINIRAIQDDWLSYTSLPGAKVLSQPSNIQVPVIEWMLINPDIDIGQAAYDIVFIGEGFDEQIAKASRSGRAVMVTLQALGGGGLPYVLPSIVRGSAGKNFIELAIGTKQVAQQVAQILVRRIQ